MATKRKSTKGKGITLYGVVLGLLLGLAAAVAVALFVTQVPMPFADKASRSTPTVLLPDVRDAPDPNLGLHGREGGAVPGTGVTPSITPPAGPAKPPAGGSDDIANLIASLGQGQTPPPGSPPVENQISTPSQVATPSPPATPSAPPAARQQGTYYLQAGAFRGTNDAEAMRARVIMLGMSAQIQAANVNGTTLHRVRVGPFNGLDEMNKARSRLGNEKIETSVVRQ
ncbi:SPOR domain-containing protein [Alcaligenaceae bacterium]|nr:SPOR domain-containing protein [Alcaligenaceae bacterium]